MKTLIGLILFAALTVSCHSSSSNLQMNDSSLVFDARDREIADSLLMIMDRHKKLPAGELMVKIGQYFLNTPYVAHTLETGKDEKLVINLREMDCTTFAENILALTLTVKSKDPGFNRFVKEIERIRYRNGIRDGYLSRLHYFSDWIFDNHQKKIVRDVSRDIAHILYPNRTDFMSTHPLSYKVLSENPGLIGDLETYEKEISERKAWYIPKKNLHEFEDQLTDGDIVAITTNIEGLDVVHVGIVIRAEGGKVRMLHASSREMKVVVTEETLNEYLQGSKTTTGIMVARPI
jgi:hypothetical protein